MTVRITVDVNNDLHQDLRLAAVQDRVTLADLGRVLYQAFLDDPALRERTVTAIRAGKTA